VKSRIRYSNGTCGSASVAARRAVGAGQPLIQPQLFLGLLQIVSKPSAPRPSVSSMPPGGTGTREVVVVMVEQRLRAHLAHNIGHSATQLTRNGL
jgi:hypothetical protein